MNKYCPLPKLRFKHFKEKYSTIKVNEVAIINPKHQLLPDEFVYINLECVKKGILLKENIINKSFAPSRAQRVLENGDILYQSVRPYQKNNYLFELEGNYVASTGYLQVKTHINNKYLFQYFHNNKFVNKVLKMCTGANYPTINSGDFGNIKLNLPSLPEQQKIASFLSSVDDKLKQLIKKKELLEEYKKGVMQKIFSQELRFKDDNGNNYPHWEEKTIEDLFIVTRGTVLAIPKISPYKNDECPYPVYSSQTKNNGIAGYYKDYLFEDAITWTTDGAQAGEVNLRKGKFYCTNVCGVLKSDEGYANLCITEKLNRVSRKYVSYVGNPKLMNNVMAKIKISIPSSLDEQKKIANFLSLLDSKIELVSNQIENTKAFKKGLLQQMFV